MQICGYFIKTYALRHTLTKTGCLSCIICLFPPHLNYCNINGVVQHREQFLLLMFYKRKHLK